MFYFPLQQVALNYLTTLRNDERIQNHQLDVKFQEKYLEKVCGLLRCNLREGAVGIKDAAENGESADVEGDKVQDPMDVEEGELPDSQGELIIFLMSEGTYVAYQK